MENVYNFNNKKISELVNTVEYSEKFKANLMNQISEDIRKLEMLFKKWDIKKTLTSKDDNYEISWNCIDKRLLCKMSEINNRPLIEFPFIVRQKISENGLLEKLLMLAKNYFESEEI